MIKENVLQINDMLFVPTPMPTDTVVPSMNKPVSWHFSIDLVNEGFTMHRLTGTIKRGDGNVDIRYYSSEIGELDYYERCVEKLCEHTD